jgi:hypothetical protein
LSARKIVLSIGFILSKWRIDKAEAGSRQDLIEQKLVYLYIPNTVVVIRSEAPLASANISSTSSGDRWLPTSTFRRDVKLILSKVKH